MIRKSIFCIKPLSVVCAIALLTGVAGCAGVGEPLTYVAADEIQPGPGMLTGKKGHFGITLWDDVAEAPAQQAHGLTRSVPVPVASAKAPVLPPDTAVSGYRRAPASSAPDPVRPQRRRLVSDAVTAE